MKTALNLRSTLMVTATAASLMACSAPAHADSAKLDYRDLFRGYKAYKVTLNEAGKAVQLDERVFKFGKEKAGVIITDPISIVPSQAGIDISVPVSKLDVSIEGQVPASASISASLRAGDHPYDTTNWSNWEKLPRLSTSLKNIKGDFVQLKIELAASKQDAIPSVSSIAMTAHYADEPQSLQRVGVIQSDIQRIVASPIEFKYEKPDHPDLVKFAESIKLNEIVADQPTDFDKLVKLMDWVAACRNDRKEQRHRTEGGYYAWDIDKVFSMEQVTENGKKVIKPTIYGHCMSYSEVMISAAIALGYKARHMVDRGFRDMCHEVVEVWVPSLNKWVYFDPSLSNYYYDKETMEPLNIIQMHDIVKDTFLPEGKDMNWFFLRKSQETREYVKKIGGQTPIGSRMGDYHYGKPAEENYDWGWRHGYLAAGFVQMTPRNDFESHPEANPKKFGGYAGYAGYPYWVDEKTPPKKGVNNWYTRMRDFYWTLDQASFRLSKTDTNDDALLVKLGNSMPFFKEYRVEINGQSSSSKKDRLEWQLEPGMNTLAVSPVDKYGQSGTPSSVTVVLHE